MFPTPNIVAGKPIFLEMILNSFNLDSELLAVPPSFIKIHFFRTKEAEKEQETEGD